MDADPNLQSTGALVEIIRDTFGRHDALRNIIVPKEQVLDWMKVNDLQVQGVLYTKIAEQKYANRISPHLSFDDYYQFVIPYLERCIIENVDKEWVESRYLASHQLVTWFVDFWHKKAPQAALQDFKMRLALLYKNGDEGVRDAVVNGVLEHLLEHKKIGVFFREWQNDPDLAVAYQTASLWSKD